MHAPTLYQNRALFHARAAMWAGLASLLCLLLSPCTCYTSLLLAVPFGAYGGYASVRALSAPDLHPAASHMPAAGLISALFGFSISALMLAIIALYVLLYLLMIVGVLVLAAAA